MCILEMYFYKAYQVLRNKWSNNKMLCLFVYMFVLAINLYHFLYGSDLNVYSELKHFPFLQLYPPL